MTLKIGNAQGFWGDRPDAAFDLASGCPDIDVITLDYLAEVSMSIMAVQKEKDPSLGYARDVVEVVRSLVPLWKGGRSFKVITNGGGLNPLACGQACREVLRELPIKISVVTGDDVLEQVSEGDLVTANAYLGAQGIVQALEKGAQIIITGRVADPSLVVAPCVHHYGWSWEAWDQLAGATVAGHLIECGTQVTGGISTDWLSLEKRARIGFPVVEVSEDGACVVTKNEGTDGAVTVAGVKEQLLYELGDPDCYLSPDVTVSFLNLSVEEVGKDSVLVQGAKGRPPDDRLKVSATYKAGWKSEAMLALFGRGLKEKAFACGEVIRARLGGPQHFLTECLGGGDLVPGVYAPEDPLEGVVRFAIRDDRRDVVERFAKEIASLVTSGPQGITGYTSGRPKVRPAFGYRPLSIESNKIKVEVHDV